MADTDMSYQPDPNPGPAARFVTSANRIAPHCWVLYECPACGLLATLDAHRGVPLCKECPKTKGPLKPYLVPIDLAMTGVRGGPSDSGQDADGHGDDSGAEIDVQPPGSRSSDSEGRQDHQPGV